MDDGSLAANLGQCHGADRGPVGQHSQAAARARAVRACDAPPLPLYLSGGLHRSPDDRVEEWPAWYADTISNRRLEGRVLRALFATGAVPVYEAGRALQPDARRGDVGGFNHHHSWRSRVPTGAA